MIVYSINNNNDYSNNNGCKLLIHGMDTSHR